MKSESSLAQVTISELTGGLFVDAQEAAEQLGFSSDPKDIQKFRSRLNEKIAGYRVQGGRQYALGAVAAALPAPAALLRGSGRGALVFKADDVAAAKPRVAEALGKGARAKK